MNNVLLAILAAIAALTATPAAAHDFFLLPKGFHVHGSELVIRATIGSSFPTPEIVVPSDRVERTWVVGSGKPQLHITGTDETSLLLHVADAGSGKLLVAVKSKPRDVDYSEDRIALILEEYRVAPEAVAAVEALPSPRTWQVNSRRFAKTLACVHSCHSGADTNISLDGALEFVTHSTSAEHFHLIAGGKPLADYPVDLVGSDGKRQHLRTDATGMVEVPAGGPGPIMLFAAVLTPPTGAGRFTLDLTSLSFSR